MKKIDGLNDQVKNYKHITFTLKGETIELINETIVAGFAVSRSEFLRKAIMYYTNKYIQQKVLDDNIKDLPYPFENENLDRMSMDLKEQQLNLPFKDVNYELFKKFDKTYCIYNSNIYEQRTNNKNVIRWDNIAKETDLNKLLEGTL